MADRHTIYIFLNYFLHDFPLRKTVIFVSPLVSQALALLDTRFLLWAICLFLGLTWGSSKSRSASVRSFWDLWTSQGWSNLDSPNGHHVTTVSPTPHTVNQLPLDTSFGFKCQKLRCHDFSALADWSPKQCHALCTLGKTSKCWLGLWQISLWSLQ